MINILKNLWHWYLDNSEHVNVILSAVAAIFTATATIIVSKQKRTINENTKSINNIDTITKDYNDLVSSNKEITEKLTSVNHNLEEVIKLLNTNNYKVGEAEDATLESLVKLNSIIDVMSLAYSTLKNDTNRIAIGNIITNTKYNDKTAKLIEKRNGEIIKESVSAKKETKKNTLNFDEKVEIAKGTLKSSENTVTTKKGNKKPNNPIKRY